MIKTVLDKLVDRFLGWKVPETFGPDCGVSFTKPNSVYPEGYPVGTNLLTAVEAKAMFQHVASNLPMLSEYLKGTGVSLYTYNAKVVKIVDADTVDVLVDLGFEVYKKLRCRLAGINAPELNTDSGKIAKAFLIDALPINDPVVIISKDYDKYGRSVAVIYHYEVNINQMLLETGHAVPYIG